MAGSLIEAINFGDSALLLQHHGDRCADACPKSTETRGVLSLQGTPWRCSAQRGECDVPLRPEVL
jgi:hypothetical protein